MNRAHFLVIPLIVAFCVSAFAQGGTGKDIGIGTRAFAFAGNHTAAVNDLSAAYWNPAALAFLPVREFQVSFDGTRTYGETSYVSGGAKALADARMGDYRDRISLRGIGAMTAVPTVQGGLTLAVAYESPFAFDDFSVCGYSYGYGDTAVIENTVRYGDLNHWSFAFGVQVAPKLAAGLTVSIISGTDLWVSKVDKWVPKVDDDNKPYNDLKVTYNFLGYSMTGGFRYVPNDHLRVGLCLNMMMDLDVKKTEEVTWWEGYDWRDEYGRPDKSQHPISGDAYRAPYGALGIGLTLPWLIAALDLRLVMPYTFILTGEDIPNNSQARNFKAGAGIGIEAPLPIAAPVMLRAGYSIDECDLYPVVNRLDESIDWEDGTNYFLTGGKHTLSLGTAVFTSGVGFELSYGYQAWSVRHKDKIRRVGQEYSNHRVMGAIIFRY
jgi:hypothetical protein